MTRGLRRVATLTYLAAVLGTAGCGNDVAQQPDDPPASPSTTETFNVPSTSDEPMPPAPTTACLPATPVELDLGPYLLGCALTPTAWTITNTSRTVIHLTAGAGSTFPTVTVRPAAPADPRPDVSNLLTGVYDLYRSQERDGLWLQPDATVDVAWPGDTPGTLRYQSAPADSAAMSAATALAESAIEEASSGPRGVSADDVLSCYQGVRDMAKAVTDGQYAPATDTWNTVIEDGLTAHTCFNLLPEQSRGKLKAAVLSAGQETLSELKPIWRQFFSIRLPR